ncbi:hypothetical protein FRB90_003321 [Tulasnella sp. 427]|nr:hypothetical protein FRB90_003321 [Tulasnella sp. 427]
MSAHPSSSNSELIFYGTDGIEAEEFIRSVKKAARAASKLRDNDWIVDEVSVALAGDALRWYIDLDEETQSDWVRLQRAIVRQYPRKVAPIPGPSEPATIPTPAAAISHPLAAPVATVTEKRFYIRIAFRHRTRSAYVTIRDGYLAPTSSRSEAIQVRHDPETERLFVTNKNYTNGTSIALSYSSRSLKSWKLFAGCVAWLHTIDESGATQVTSPIVSLDGVSSLSSWKVKNDCVLQLNSQASAVRTIDLFVDSDIAETKQVILAFLNYPISQSNISPQRMELLNLKLEEV